MNKWLNRSYLLLTIFSILFFPWLGGYLRWGGLPPGFGLLADQNMEPPAFNLSVFIVLAIIGAGIWALVFFPRLFGFKTIAQAPIKGVAEPMLESVQKRFPWWFWGGGVVCGLSWLVMWGQFAWLGWARYLTFVPLWAGFIVLLDGIVYYRTDGISWLSQQPKRLALCAMLSMFGWYYFEYLNFFVLQNWYYPYLDLLPTPFTYFWSALTFATIWPSIFVWYQLLNTFKPLRQRYQHGPVILLSRRALVVLLISGMLMAVATSVWYNALFWLIWVGPLLIVASSLGLLRVWTPFDSIARGDWGAIMLIAIATVFNSIPWEMWNYWSPPNNPNFWRYNLPYVQVLKIFEMPLLGFSGYLFFGPVCWVMWILCAKLFGFSSRIDLAERSQ